MTDQQRRVRIDMIRGRLAAHEKRHDDYAVDVGWLLGELSDMQDRLDPAEDRTERTLLDTVAGR